MPKAKQIAYQPGYDSPENEIVRRWTHFRELLDGAPIQTILRVLETADDEDLVTYLHFVMGESL